MCSSKKQKMQEILTETSVPGQTSPTRLPTSVGQDTNADNVNLLWHRFCRRCCYCSTISSQGSISPPIGLEDKGETMNPEDGAHFGGITSPQRSSSSATRQALRQTMTHPRLGGSEAEEA